MAYVNYVQAANGNVTSFALPALNCTTGNLIVVLWTSQEGSGGDTVTASDTAGNTYTGLTIRGSGGGGASAKILYAYNITGSASNVITVTIGTSRRYMVATAMQFSGMDTTSGVYVGESGGVASATTTISAGSISVTGNAVAVGCFSSTNDRTWTAGSGYTEVYDGGGSHMSEYQIGTASSYNPGATASDSSNLVAAAAVFKEASTGSHTTTGALSSDSATISGTSTHLTLHSTTGAMSAQSATASGTAAHVHASTGALSAQAATASGTAAHRTLHTTTGALSAQASSTAGAAAHEHASTGALAAQDSAIAGSADHAAGGSFASTGALSAQDATVSGSSTHLTLHTTTGALDSQAATVSSAATHPHTTTGALSAQAAAISGAAAHATLHATSGAMNAQAAAITGAAAHEHATAGALTVAAAEIAGAALRLDAGVHATEGALQSQDATLAGSAALTPNPDGALTDPKFQGPSHNTRIRWERKRKEEAAAAKEAEIAEPLAPEPGPSAAPESRSTGLGEIVLPPVEVVAPEIKVPEIRVVAPAKAATAGPKPVPISASVGEKPASTVAATPPAISTVAPSLQQTTDAALAQVTAVLEGAVAGLTREVVRLQKQVQRQAEAHAREMARVTEMLRAAEKREINRARAEALARKIAEDDE